MLVHLIMLYQGLLCRHWVLAFSGRRRPLLRLGRNLEWMALILSQDQFSMVCIFEYIQITLLLHLRPKDLRTQLGCKSLELLYRHHHLHPHLPSSGLVIAWHSFIIWLIIVGRGIYRYYYTNVVYNDKRPNHQWSKSYLQTIHDTTQALVHHRSQGAIWIAQLYNTGVE